MLSRRSANVRSFEASVTSRHETAAAPQVKSSPLAADHAATSRGAKVGDGQTAFRLAALVVPAAAALAKIRVAFGASPPLDAVFGTLHDHVDLIVTDVAALLLVRQAEDVDGGHLDEVLQGLGAAVGEERRVRYRRGGREERGNRENECDLHCAVWYGLFGLQVLCQ
jgi:hypothetical protein